ncbi:hypothetical protein BOO92_20065 [Vibrio navarrensis]|nr:hypothetical protein [Vibrio navarrensis]
MLNHQKSVVYDCSLFPWLVSFVLVGKLASVGAVFWTSILGQARGYGGWLNQQFELRFLSISGQSSMSDFQNHESFPFFRFWLLFVNQGRVNLGFIKT